MRGLRGRVRLALVIKQRLRRRQAQVSFIQRREPTAPTTLIHQRSRAKDASGRAERRAARQAVASGLKFVKPLNLPQSFGKAPDMKNWIQMLRQKWDDWCGDHDMEHSIRNHLSQNGYFGNTAKFRAVRLVAVQRPGWLQVYRFEVEARVNPVRRGTDGRADSGDPSMPDGDGVSDGFAVPRSVPPPTDGVNRPAEYCQLFGLVREDHRHNRSNVRVFDNETERKELFERWSEGLVCLRGAKGLVSS